MFHTVQGQDQLGGAGCETDASRRHILFRLLEGKVGSGKGQELEGRCAGCVVRTDTDEEGPHKYVPDSLAIDVDS
jgi:hypothetical protein